MKIPRSRIVSLLMNLGFPLAPSWDNEYLLRKARLLPRYVGLESDEVMPTTAHDLETLNMIADAKDRGDCLEVVGDPPLRTFPMPMTMEEVEGQLEAIRDAAHNGDHEVAHSLQDALYEDALRDIARGRMSAKECQQLAFKVLLSRRIRFPRYRS